MQHLFLTGSTGFIGVRLLRKWLTDSSALITLMMRPRDAVSPRQRLGDLLRTLERNGPAGDYADRITIIEGDLGLPELGLSKDDRLRLRQTVTHIIHCAASVRFDLDLGEARRINNRGTQEMLSLAHRCHQLQRFDYLSTAYVAGCRNGCIREDELDVGQEHHNNYERSKFEAEKLVAAASRKLPVAIHRPSIVICDSETGELPRHSPFYRLLKYYAAGTLRCMPGSPDACFDLVPVNFVVDALFELARRDESLGRCFHLSAGCNATITLGDILDISSRYLERPVPRLISGEEFEHLARTCNDDASADSSLFEELTLYSPYLNSKLRFDNSNLLSTLRANPLEQPAFSSYFNLILDYVAHDG